jgi:hypothetical protein
MTPTLTKSWSRHITNNKMSNENNKHENPDAHGNYERQDLQPAGIIYFLLALAVVTVACILGLRGLYTYLDRREKSSQPDVNPLVTNVPEDTRHVSRGYPQSAFPNPKLEEDERGQLNDIRTNEEKELYSYGWVDEKAGTLHIPIERAMDLIVQRGLPAQPQAETGDGSVAKAQSNQQSGKTQGPSKAKNK